MAGGNRQSTALTLDHKAGQAVVLSATPGSPGDLFQINIASGADVKLTGVNREYLDEHPAAYKDIDQVMEDQKDLCRPIHELRQVLNYKGA